MTTTVTLSKADRQQQYKLEITSPMISEEQYAQIVNGTVN